MSFTNTSPLFTLSILQEQRDPHFLLLECESESQLLHLYLASIVGQKQTLKLLQVGPRTVSELPQAPGEAQVAATLMGLSEVLQFRFSCSPVLPVPGVQTRWVGNALELTSTDFLWGSSSIHGNSAVLPRLSWQEQR